MEKKHKYICCFGFIFAFIITYIFRLDFYIIASESISVVSIALAIYTISISALIGSEFSKKLQETQHFEKKDFTQLDIIINYFKNAAVISIITIVFSMIKMLDFSLLIQKIAAIPKISSIISVIDLSQTFSSICFAFLALNFIFICLIIKFVTNRQLRNK